MGDLRLDCGFGFFDEAIGMAVDPEFSAPSLSFPVFAPSPETLLRD
jgi:hypothetical protein